LRPPLEGERVTNHDPRVSIRTLDSPSLDVHVSTIAGRHVVNVSGELDVRTRHFVEQACVAGDASTVVVEMGELTFMDCCGYAGLVAARRVLQDHGGSLTLSHEVGQPARLLAMLASPGPTNPHSNRGP
jgi:anti-anti-sigma factor